MKAAAVILRRCTAGLRATSTQVTFTYPQVGLSYGSLGWIVPAFL